MKHIRFFVIVIAALVSALALTFSAPAAAAHFQNVSVEQMLNPDGTLNLSAGGSGALDLRGWNVTLDSKRGPILTRRRGGSEPLQKPTRDPHARSGTFDPAAPLALSWQALPNNGLSNTVTALAVSGSDLYVGGAFTQTADGAVTNLNRIAKFSGGAWSALPNNGLNNNVYALAVSGSDLYVGGAFTQTADGAVTNLRNIAKFSGGAWLALPNRGLDNFVLALAISGSDLYVGGQFAQTADGAVTYLSHIAKFSGGAWSAFPNKGLSGDVTALAVSGSDLYVGGYFIKTVDCYDFPQITCVTNLNNIAKFSGGAWSALPNNGLNNQVNALAVSGSDLYVGGNFSQTFDGMVTNLRNIAKLSGGTWSALPHNGLNNPVTALAVSGSDLYVGGTFTQTADGAVTNLNNIAKFSGGAWSAFPNNGLNGIFVLALAFSGSDLYVGGYFDRTADSLVTNLNRIARFSSAPVGFQLYLPLILR